MNGSDEGPIGVLLFNMGGPETLDAVEPFLVRLFSDRQIIRLPVGAALQPLFARLIAKVRGPAVRRNYALIGGGSPQLRITRAQAAALERRLNEPTDGLSATSAPRKERVGGRRFRVFMAMRYTRPSAEEALGLMEAAGIRRVITLPLYPHWSSATTGSSQGDLRRVLAARQALREDGFDLAHIDHYSDTPMYLDALAQTVADAYSQLSPEGRAHGVILFSAHGLPQRLVDAGDPYVEQIEATRNGLLERLKLPNRQLLGYQSRAGPVRWTGPGTDELIAGLGASGVKHLLVVPLSFVSDHIETLYEVDILFRQMAVDAGIREYRRPDALNTHPLFIEALARLVMRQVEPDSGCPWTPLETIA
jgi:ferrochelatase